MAKLYHIFGIEIVLGLFLLTWFHCNPDMGL